MVNKCEGPLEVLGSKYELKSRKMCKEPPDHNLCSDNSMLLELG